MLSAAAKEKLKSFGFDITELETAFKDEKEIDVKIPNGSFFTDETLAARDNNKISEGKTLGIAEGKTAGFEIANKLMIEKFGLKDVKKSDEPIKIAEALEVTVQSGDEGLKNQVKALQTDVQAWEQKYTQLESAKTTIERNTQLLGYFPKNRKDTLTDSEYLELISKNLDEVDGKLAIKINGEVLRDKKTRDIVDLKDGVDELFKARKWVNEETPPSGGRGAGDGHASRGGIKTYSAAKEQYLKDNPDSNETDPKFVAYVREVATSTPDFDIDK
jgi:hypothetical protein